MDYMLVCVHMHVEGGSEGERAVCVKLMIIKVSLATKLHSTYMDGSWTDS